jgi:hypothetical protein
MRHCCCLGREYLVLPLPLIQYVYLRNDAAAAMLREITGQDHVGTDSLASTGSLSMISELRLLQDTAPHYRWRRS